mmetsp:Transcript_54458/g.153359  ORF Transcript_54458/g.153359 Transcript_54458/m.153359 type:complete len:204 (+) Transcript_54458:1014-1625(+)
MYSQLGSGGTNRSPSSRLSDRLGLKRSLRKCLSSSSNTDPAPQSRLDQKAPPTTACMSGGWGYLPRASTCLGADRSNASRLRSTPRARVWPSTPMDGFSLAWPRARSSSIVRPKTACVWRPRPVLAGMRAAAMRLTLSMMKPAPAGWSAVPPEAAPPIVVEVTLRWRTAPPANLSRPKSTPPYTPYILVLFSHSAPLISPSRT